MTKGDQMKRLKDMDDSRNGWYEVSPADAGELLEGRPRNRNLSEHKAEQIAKRIVAKRWKANGESIILDNKGRILDGQHRLRACQIAGMPIKVYVVYVPLAAGPVFDTVDTGWARNAAHRFAAEGVENYVLKAAIVALEARYQAILAGTQRSMKVDHDAALQAYKAEPGEYDFAAHVAALNSPKLRGRISPSILGLISLHAARSNQHEQATSFWESVANGANLAPSNAALHLRNLVTVGLGSKTAKYDNRRMLALTIKAWVMYREKKAVRMLKWDAEREAYPSLSA